MLLETAITITALVNGVKILSGIVSALGLIFGVFKLITWIKNKFISIDNNVVELKKSMDTHIGGLRDDIKNQTTVLSTALAEQRSDFRTFYGPSLLYNMQQQTQQAVPVRAKRAPRKTIRKK